MKVGRTAGALAAALALAGQVDAANPLHEDICVADPTSGKQVVNREKLATFILKDKAVGWQFGQWAQQQIEAEKAAHDDAVKNGRPIPAASPYSTPEFRILMCDPTAQCVFEGSDKIMPAQNQLSDILTDQTGSFHTNKAGDFFANSSIVVECLSDGKGRTIEITGSGPTPPDLDLPFKLRGTVDSLMFLRGQADFKAADKLTVNWTEDGINSKHTIKLVGVVGIPIPLIGERKSAGGENQYVGLELAPYAGINHDFSTTTGKDRVITSRDWRLGATLIGRLSSSFGSGEGNWRMINVVELRPEMLFDEKTHAEIASVNLRYLPVTTRILGLPIGLNAYRRIIPNEEFFFSYRPILDIRFNNGTFTKQGTRLPIDAEDFSRIGTQFGFAIGHDNPRIPIDLVVTETLMYAFAGDPRTLSQFKSVLSFSFDSNSYFGFDLSFSRGRREDLLSREDKWSVGLTARY